MKVKEIAQVFYEYSDFFVVQNGKYLPGDRTSFFLDCELEIKEISIGIPDCLIIEV